MRLSQINLASFFLLLVSTTILTQPSAMAVDDVCLFSEANYAGDVHCFNWAEKNVSLSNESPIHLKNTKSLRMGGKYILVACESPGQCITFQESYSKVHQDDLDKFITVDIVFNRPNQFCFFQRKRMQGFRYFCVDPSQKTKVDDVSKLVKSTNIKIEINSFTGPTYQFIKLCSEIGLKGNCLTLNQSSSNLGTLSGRVKSFEILKSAPKNNIGLEEVTRDYYCPIEIDNCNKDGVDMGPTQNRMKPKVANGKKQPELDDDWR